MIHIEHKRTPPELLRPATKAAFKRLAAFFYRSPSRRRQQRPFDLRPLERVRPKLARLTHYKCAYCEQPLHSNFEIDHYRPYSLEKERRSEDHYWWLIYTWNNLLPACLECSRYKRNLFPVAARRCAPKASEIALPRERPVWISPTEPEVDRFFDFTPTGHIWPRQGLTESDLDRARRTIDDMQLDRESLVAQRAEAITAVGQLTRALMRMRNGTSNRLLRMLLSELDGSRPFTAACRWAFAQRAHALDQHVGTGAGRDGLARCLKLAASYVRTVEGSMHVEEKSHLRVRARSTQRATTPRVVQHFTLRAVEVDNFRMIRRARFEVPAERPKDLITANDTFGVLPLEPSQDPYAVRARGWKMLLGENGAGKSSMLQALAIALSGEEQFMELGPLFKNSLRAGARAGSIRIFFHEEKHPLELRIGRSGIQRLSRTPPPNIFLRAYGATRLLPRESAEKPAASEWNLPLQKVDNLFDAYVPLVDAAEWLRSLQRIEFDQACITLKDLLAIEKDQGDLAFEVRSEDKQPSGAFGLRKGKLFTPLQHFSAGYQTIVGLACDIMAGYRSQNKLLSDMRYAPGIVIIDELGINLHPRWRMRIIRSLERTFCNMQFIASTHEPLCLHGLGEGEVAVLEWNKDEPRLRDDLPSPAGLRTDQLLTSEFFGLSTTLDPATEEKFAIYYDLLARCSELKPKEQTLLTKLGDDLNKRTVLGSSRRDQFILNVVDRYFASARSLKSSAAKAKVSERVKRTIERALSSVAVQEIH